MTTAETDYLVAAGTLTFAPGQLTKTFTVLVKGDTLLEGDEPFGIILSAPFNARIADGWGLATINNDDSPTTSPRNVPERVGSGGKS